MESTRKPTDVDRFIASQIRSLRRLRGMSQEQLSAKIGISYQQIQKYEAGTNRVTAATLFMIAGVLNRDVKDFFPEGGTGTDVLQGLDPRVTDALHRLIDSLKGARKPSSSVPETPREYPEIQQYTD